jgi:isocitrate dehydrogenase
MFKAENPIVELDGDEMARVVWRWVKEQLILPYLDVSIQYFDLGLPNRDATDDKVTIEAAEAIKRVGIGVKCAAINPDQARVEEYGLKKAWKSPNAQVRNIIGGTLFRQPIMCRNVPRRLPRWTKPIFVARHAFGDQFAATDISIPEEGTLYLRFVPTGGGPEVQREVYNFPGPGVALGMYNLDDSIRGFAHSCMRFALDQGLPLFLGTKNTALKVYDQRFKDIFEETYEREFAESFQANNIHYEHRMVDELAAYAIKSEGGFVYACKNHDGDVQSDMVAEAFGSLGLMASLLITPDGNTVQTEAAHGSITRHYREHQAGRETSTNPMASIFAWTRAIFYRGQFDGTPELCRFAEDLERACIKTVESGSMTKDLALLAGVPAWLTTREFLGKVNEALRTELAA